VAQFVSKAHTKTLVGPVRGECLQNDDTSIRRVRMPRQSPLR
jgi:hypothetical protein